MLLYLSFDLNLCLQCLVTYRVCPPRKAIIQAGTSVVANQKPEALAWAQT